MFLSGVVLAVLVDALTVPAKKAEKEPAPQTIAAPTGMPQRVSAHDSTNRARLFVRDDRQHR